MNINDDQFRERNKKETTSWEKGVSSPMSKTPEEGDVSPQDEIIELLSKLVSKPLLLLEGFLFLTFDPVTGWIAGKHFGNMPQSQFAFFDRFSKKLYFSSDIIDPAAQGAMQEYLSETCDTPIECVQLNKDEWKALEEELADKDSYMDSLRSHDTDESEKKLIEEWEEFIEELEKEAKERKKRGESERELSLEQLAALLAARANGREELEAKYREYIKKARERRLEEKRELGEQIIQSAEIRTEDTKKRLS